MKNLLLFPVQILILTSAATISPLVLLNTSDIVNTVVNRPVVGAPDPRFSIEASLNGPKLPPISCLMNSVEILVVLGLRDFSGSMEEAAWKLDEYPEVGEGEKVGTIDLVDWPATQYTSRGTHIKSMQNLTQQPNLLIEEIPTSRAVFPQYTDITAEDAQDQRLMVRVKLTGSTVPLFDFFLLVITVLVDAARLGATERLQDYASPVNVPGVETRFKGPVPARTSPPFFESYWLMKTMATIPKYMIKKGVFREAFVLVEIDGVRVADGVLEKKAAGVGLTIVNSD